MHFSLPKGTINPHPIPICPGNIMAKVATYDKLGNIIIYPTDINVGNPDVAKRPGGIAAHTITVKIQVQNKTITPYEHPKDIDCLGSFVIDVINVKLSIPARPQVQYCRLLSHGLNPPTNQ